MAKTTDSSYIIDDSSGAVLNNDEQAWLKYKSQRDSAIAIQKLQKQVNYLIKAVKQLEEKLNETTTNS